MTRLIVGTPRRIIPPNQTTTNNGNTTTPTDITNDADIDDDGSDVTSNPSAPPQLDEDSDSDDLLEPWVDYIKRATHAADQMITKLHIEEWTTTAWKRQWQWARRIATQQLGRWSSQLARWDPRTDDTRHTS